MSQVLELSPETVALIESHAGHAGVSVEEYLRSLLPASADDLGLRADDDLSGFDSDLESFASDVETSPAYKGSFSREDIYVDHN